MKRAIAIAIAAAAGLSGCGGLAVLSPTPAPQAPASYPSALSVDKLVGNWGVASYRQEKDKARTEAQARAQCKLPYVIKKGPTDGVMMHVADDTVIHELTFKGGPGGKTYLGFAGPPGDDQDREVLTLTDAKFVVRYVNSETDARFGTLVYIRCNSART